MNQRRSLLLGAGGVALLAAIAPRVAHATPESMQAAIRAVTGGRAIRAGRVTLDIPPLSENGNAVPLAVSVDSPMSEADHVRAIHVFNERNPEPGVVSVHLGPRAGHARFTTRIRLADTQTVTAIAEMSDSSFWSGSADVVVTLAACTETL